MCILIIALLSFFGPPIVMRSWQLGWHLYHRDHLKLHHTAYTVPTRWFVEASDPSKAFLVDAPFRIKKVTTIVIDDSPGNSIDPDSRLAIEKKFWRKDFGEIQGTYRFHSAVGEFACLESTSRIAGYVSSCWNTSGGWTMFVGDRERIGDYYAILASARKSSEP